MRSILIIEDEAAVRLMISTALMEFGFVVETAANGLEGKKAFDEGRFDLVVTDICMPGLDGIGVLRHIRNSKKACTPVIGISGTDWLFAHHDFDALLAKPFSIKRLVDAINSLTSEKLKKRALG